MTDDTQSDGWFPSDWLSHVQHGDHSHSFSIQCFAQPDYAGFEKERLNDEDLFLRLILTMRDLQHARSSLTFIQEEVEWETK